MTETGGLLNEVVQTTTEFGKDVYRSGFSPEDLPSNAAGTSFAAYLGKYASLSEAFEAWMEDAGALPVLHPDNPVHELPPEDPSDPPGDNRGSNCSRTPLDEEHH